MNKLHIYPVALFLVALVGATSLLIAAGLAEPVVPAVSLKQSRQMEREPIGVCLHVPKTLVCPSILHT